MYILPAAKLRPFRPHLIDIQAAVVAVGQERAHIKLSFAQKVTLPSLNHGSPFRDTLPGRVQKLLGKEVQRNVDTFTSGLPQQVIHERGVSGTRCPR